MVRTRVDSPSPRAFGLATLIASDVVLAEDESAVLQEFHQRVLTRLTTETAKTAPSPLTTEWLGLFDSETYLRCTADEQQ